MFKFFAWGNYYDRGGNGFVDYLKYASDVSATSGDGNKGGYGVGSGNYISKEQGSGYGDGQYYGDGEGDSAEYTEDYFFLEYHE